MAKYMNLISCIHEILFWKIQSIEAEVGSSCPVGVQPQPAAPAAPLAPSSGHFEFSDTLQFLFSFNKHSRRMLKICFNNDLFVRFFLYITTQNWN